MNKEKKVLKKGTLNKKYERKKKTTQTLLIIQNEMHVLLA